MSIAREKAEKQARKEKRMAVQAEWQKENTTQFTIRLQNSTDADLIERLKEAPSRQGEIKRLVRLGIEYERLQKEGQPLPQEKPMPLRPVEKKKGMIDLRKVVRGTVDNPGSVPDPE